MFLVFTVGDIHARLARSADRLSCPLRFSGGGEPVAKPVQAWMWVPAVNTLIIIAEDPL